MRITTSMVQRNVLSDLNTLSEPARQDAGQGRLQQGDHAAVGRSVQGRAARWACARTSAPTSSSCATSRTRRAGWTRPSPRWTRSPTTSPRATTCCCRARTDTADADVAQGARRRDRPDHPGHQGDARTPRYGDKYIMSGTATAVAAVQARRRRHLPGRRGRPGPGDARHRARDRPGRDDDDQLGRARGPRRRPGPADGKLLSVAARHLRPPQGQRRRRAARRRHRGAADASVDELLERPRPQRRADEPPRGRHARASTRSRAPLTSSSRTPRTPTSPRR